MKAETNLVLKNIKDYESSNNHIPSIVNPDTLFNFTTDISYLIFPLKNKMLSPRYCEENISYLRVQEDKKRIKKIYIPMKCFCDINLHRIREHLNWYGFYGLAFTKEWAMRNNIQPIHYINPSSNFRKDFTKAFNLALKTINLPESILEKNLKSQLLSQLVYMKPYSGKMENRLQKKTLEKCFTDECEWRYIPDVSKTDYSPIYFGDTIIDLGNIKDLSDSMIENKEISLTFEYSDLKYIIVKTDEDFRFIVKEIEKFALPKEEIYDLISKIIIWDNDGGDF